ncbi:WRKY DNA-binding protein 33 isoform 2 [Theobroma cacao]|uniref:WRKY DNA-binding protein 33 isoform 2 n=1 Tax=Theobroma cacao TaxID=3641 RepID=A0A061GZ53_THECC|nr:WRKY DNA-binding protein 33 isoform 2 [Theobroma cacao]
MASSCSSLDTSANSHPQNAFSFAAHPFMTTSFSDLLASGGADDENPSATFDGGVDAKRGGGGGLSLSDRIAERTGSGVPKFKSLPPPSLPIFPPPVSPSSYFAIPAGLSPAELLDSPVLLNASNVLPSPTTGTFPAQAFNWKSNSGNNLQNVKQEDKNYSNFTFQTQPRPATSSSSMFQSSTNTIQTAQQQAWSFQESVKQDDFSSGKSMVKPEYTQMQSFSPEIANIQGNSQSNSGFQSEYTKFQQQPQSIRENRRSDDGYNWRKYGQKQVKGSENPRSYYKCTFPNCPTKKKVERSLDGQITEIVYKGSHNHPKPQSTRKSLSSSSSSIVIQTSSAASAEIPDQSFATHGSGQMRSYYKCTHPGCPVRKHVERASHDHRAVITTYEGKHNHDVPAARGSGSHSVNRPLPDNNNNNNCNNNAAMAIRPSAVNNHSDHSVTNPLRSLRPPTAEGQAPFTLEMLQGTGNFGFSGFSNSMGSFMNQPQHVNNMFSRTKEEPRDEVFIESLLC